MNCQYGLLVCIASLICQYGTIVCCSAWRVGQLKQPSVAEAMRPYASPSMLFLSTLLWWQLSLADVLQAQPRVFFWFVGTLFSHTTVCSTEISRTSLHSNPLNSPHSNPLNSPYFTPLFPLFHSIIPLIFFSRVGHFFLSPLTFIVYLLLRLKHSPTHTIDRSSNFV